MRTAAAELRDHGVLVNGLIPGMTNTGIWGRPRPELQPPEVVYPAVRELATLNQAAPVEKYSTGARNIPCFSGVCHVKVDPRQLLCGLSYTRNARARAF
jgi:NAD(P)-dependent dehydrogenase (short-subunit alcohol dehydrogenase family)